MIEPRLSPTRSPTRVSLVSHALASHASRPTNGWCRCILILCVLAFGAVLSVFAIGAVLERLPQPPSLALYESVAPLYVGGYTVSGSSITQGGSAGGEIKSFSVAQECLCEVFATPTGVYAYGANTDNAFSFIAAIEPDGQWYAQQVSIGIEPAYQAQMRFGHTAAGPHSAVGYHLAYDKGAQTAFRAEQSAIGCDEGIGASACAGVCSSHGLPWTQIRARCSGLNGTILTDWSQIHDDGTHRTSAALFTVDPSSDRITLYGSDDGVTFWTLHGAWVSGGADEGLGERIVVDFSPKGGPKDLPGVWKGNHIEWHDGNRWDDDAPDCAVKALESGAAASGCWHGEREWVRVGMFWLPSLF